MRTYFGAATSRVDGPAKVTGKAKYAAEFNGAGFAYASVVSSTITRGRIVQIDASAASALDGVIGVLTHANRPRMADGDEAYMDDVAAGPEPFRPLYDGNIRFNGQPVAVVVAETSEIARHAGSLVRVDYAAEPHATDIEREQDRAYALGPDAFALSPSKPRGDAAKAFAAAPVRHEADYFIPVEHHNPMEMFASTVIRHGDGKLTVYDKTQGIQNVQRYLCRVFDKQPDDIRAVSQYMGGGFGSGLRPQYSVVLAVLAAIALKRSVHLVLTRAQMYSLGYRPGTVEHVALGASLDGALESMIYEAIGMTSQHESFARKDSIWAGALYACPNTRFAHKLVPLDVATPADMRAPGAATGVYALECAMDELAAALDMDPIELRMRNYSDRDQNSGLPFTSKALRECYRRGAEAFGWNRRAPQPRSMRDGNELVGLGMATGIWEALENRFSVRVVWHADGHAEVFSAASDIGTGTYTIVAQVAADALGLPIENVSVHLGDSTLPQAPVEGGSWTAASIANATVAACNEVKAELSRDPGVKRSEHEASNTPGKEDTHARAAHSAVFAEVRVDEQIGVIRVARIASAVAAGQIVNTKTARSQVLGSIVMGIGMALHEETLTDHRFGRIMNANFAEYHVPVNADVHEIDVVFVDEPDTLINPLGVKGIGEIGIVGVASAIANAVYHATGKRIRDLPITLDKLIAAGSSPH